MFELFHNSFLFNTYLMSSYFYSVNSHGKGIKLQNEWPQDGNYTLKYTQYYSSSFVFLAVWRFCRQAWVQLELWSGVCRTLISGGSRGLQQASASAVARWWHFAKEKNLLMFSTVAQELLTASRPEERQLSVVCLQPRRRERTIVAAEAPTNVTLKEMNDWAILN